MELGRRFNLDAAVAEVISKDRYSRQGAAGGIERISMYSLEVSWDKPCGRIGFEKMDCPRFVSA